MEHIVQFAVGIDDNAIRQRVMENAEKQIIQNIEQQVRNSLFESGYYRSNADKNSPLNEFSKKLIENFLENNKEEILEKTSKHLAEKLARTKAAKALVNEMMGE